MTILTSYALDNPHFYKASQFLYQPRLAEDELLSMYTLFGAGRSSSSLNACGEETTLLNLYGPENLHYLAEGVPNTILNKSPDSFINALWMQETGACFGNLIFDGVLRVANINLEMIKNLENGFFFDINLPLRKITVSTITYTDLSTPVNAHGVSFQEWTTYIQNLKENLARYDIQLCNEVSNGGVGDLTCMMGKTINYEETRHVDFIDATIRAGILFPTGKKANPRILFDIPTGYDGFWGIPICTAAAIGMYDWLTAGTYLNILPFLSKYTWMGIKTAEEQSGFLRLFIDRVKAYKGPLLTYGLYVEADHVSKGFTLFLGYQYNKQFPTVISPRSGIDVTIANSDARLAGWTMQTFNFIIDYDFATIEHPNRPRVGLEIDFPFRGESIIPSKMGNVSLCLDIGCSF